MVSDRASCTDYAHSQTRLLYLWLQPVAPFREVETAEVERVLRISIFRPLGHLLKH